MTNSAYPVEIIPKRWYKYICIDSLNTIPQIIISRTSNLSKEDSFDEFNQLKDRAIINSSMGILGLSMNLLGGKFWYKKHSQFRTLGKANELWEFLEKVKIDDYLSDFIEKDSPFCLLFLLDDLHNIKVPFKREVDKSLRQKLESFDSSIKLPNKNNELVEFLARSEIQHKPTKLNFWHVELHVHDMMDTLVLPKKAGWKKLISSWIVSQMIKHLIQDEVIDPRRVPKSFYKVGWLAGLWKYFGEE